MTDTLRDKLIQKGWVTPFNADTLVRLIEEHYADEPAVPEGREPAAVTEQPSDAELSDAYWKAWHGHNGRTLSASHYAGLRAVLARWGNLKGSLTSSPPADGEVAELVAQLTSRNYGPGALDRAAELLQWQVLVPVPVSERPWEREGWCDAEGKCWICGKVEGDWRLINPTNSGVPNLKYCFTHCLDLPRKLEANAALAMPVRTAIYNPVQIAECGGPCADGGPEACDCGALWRDEPQAQPSEVLAGGLQACPTGILQGAQWVVSNTPTGPDDHVMTQETADMLNDLFRIAQAAISPDNEVAELPPRPSLPMPTARPELVRYGVTWDGSPDKPLLTPIADGYWTPWHVAADLLERLAPQPVPVSERLPGPGDCDAEGRCWWFLPSRQFKFLDQCARWSLMMHSPSQDDRCRRTHWLPAHALPLPEVSE